MSNFANTLAEARQAIEVEDTESAFRALRPLLADLSDDRTQRAELFACFAEVAVRRWGPAWRELVLNALDPGQEQASYNLGSALLDKALPDIAAGVLAQTVQLHPENGALLHELVAALELQGRNQAALAALRGAPLQVRGSFLHRYLEAFNSTMVGEFDAARELFPGLAAEAGPQETLMVDRIASILARAQHLGALAPQTTASGRLCVLTGALLLDNSVASSNIFAQIRTQLNTLSRVLSAWEIHPPRVLAPPDPLSQGLAAAAGAVLGLPVERWLGEPIAGLVTGWDPRRMLPELQTLLRQHNPGQLFFAHRAKVGLEHPTCPDLLGCADHTGRLPWEAGDDDLFADVPPEPGPNEIANAVRNAVADLAMPTDIEAQMRSFAVATDRATPAAKLHSGQRDRLWAGVLLVS